MLINKGYNLRETRHQLLPLQPHSPSGSVAHKPKGDMRRLYTAVRDVNLDRCSLKVSVYMTESILKINKLHIVPLRDVKRERCIWWGRGTRCVLGSYLPLPALNGNVPSCELTYLNVFVTG